MTVTSVAHHRSAGAALASESGVGRPTLVLQDPGGRRYLDVTISASEASVIVSILERVPLSDPLPQELLMQMIALGGLALLRAEICEVDRPRSGVVSAPLIAHLLFRTSDGQEARLASRIGDAVVLVLRQRVPLLVASALLSPLRERDPFAQSSPEASLARPRASTRRQKWRVQ